MYVIEVIPLTALPPNVPQILSYYHDVALEKGAVVEVPLNHRRVWAVIVGSSIIQSQKLLLKKSGFALKKISAVISAESQVSEYQFKIALWLASHYVSPLGLCLKAVLPGFFGKKKYPTPATVLAPAERTSKPLWILSRAKDFFKNISVHFAKKGQILILVPEIIHIAYFQKQCIEPVTTIDSRMSNKDAYAVWQNVASGDARIIIGTRQALSFPFKNLRQVIVIDPLHEFYKSDLSPKYDAPELAGMIAGLYGAEIIMVSELLGVSAYHQKEQQHIALQDRIKPWQMNLEIIDMVAEMKRHYVGIFSQDVKDRLAYAIEDKKKILIVSARRGYSGILLCERCGFSFKCPKCDTPMRIHQGVTPILMCHRDGTTQPYPQVCLNCHSSHLKPTGPAGSQKIFEEMQKTIQFEQLPQTPVLILDSDVTQNETEEMEVMDTVLKPGPVILIATQKIFSFIYEATFDYIIIPQLDALSVGTDFTVSEQLWYQLEKLADFEPKEISVQTYHQKETMLAVADHQYEKMYELELQNRELFHYPPFGRLIKLSFSHPYAQKAATEGRILVEKLKMAAVHLRIRDQIFISETSPAFMHKEKGRYTYVVLIKALPGTSSLREFLRYVPSRWLIDVDPRTTN